MVDFARLAVPHHGVGMAVASVEVGISQCFAAFAMQAIDAEAVKRVTDQVGMARNAGARVGKAGRTVVIVILAGLLRVAAAFVLDFVSRCIAACGVNGVVDGNTGQCETDHAHRNT